MAEIFNFSTIEEKRVLEDWATKIFVNNKIKRKYKKRKNWVEGHLDVVLEVLQVVGSNFFFEICRYLPLEDSLKRLGWLLLLNDEVI